MRTRKQPAGNPGGKDNGMSDTLSDYISTRQAAELLGVDRSQVNRLLIDGKLKGMKPGHDWMVFRPSLDEYFKTKSAAGRPSSGEPQLKP